MFTGGFPPEKEGKTKVKKNLEFSLLKYCQPFTPRAISAAALAEKIKALIEEANCRSDNFSCSL